jgi:hypothetical protein
VFSNNLLAFPDRDFVSIEGYQAHVGEKATVTLTRGGVKSPRRWAPSPRRRSRVRDQPPRRHLLFSG